MKKKRFWLGILAMTLVLGMTVVGCDDSSGGKDGSDGKDDSKSDWLWANEKIYTVTDGVANNINYEINVTWISYTDDKHYNQQYSYTVPYNIRNETEQYTQTQFGSIQVSANNSRNGNTSQYIIHQITDYTVTVTYVNPLINGSETRVTQDITSTQTTVYDNDSGLQQSFSYQQTGTSNGTPINNNSESSYTIELLGTEGSVKTYKSTLTGGTGNYSVYKIQNGITLEQISYNYSTGGELSSTTTTTYSFPDNAIIRKKLPDYTISSSYVVYSGGSSSSYSTCEVLSDSNTELRILSKSYSNGVLSSQYETTYRRR